MQDKDILNQIENISQNEPPPDSPSHKLKDESLEEIIRGRSDIELVKSHDKNSDVESKKKKKSLKKKNSIIFLMKMMIITLHQKKILIIILLLQKSMLMIILLL